MNAVLGAEVCDWMIRVEVRSGIAAPDVLPRLCVDQILVKTLDELADAEDVRRIRRHLRQAILRCARQKQTRIMFALLPHFWIEISKCSGAIRSPTPPVVPGKPIQLPQR